MGGGSEPRFDSLARRGLASEFALDNRKRLKLRGFVSIQGFAALALTKGRYEIQSLRNCRLLVVFFLAAVAVAMAGMHPTRSEKAMVVSVHSRASDAGVEVMHQGGNAI